MSGSKKGSSSRSTSVPIPPITTPGPGKFLKKNLLTAFSKPSLLHPQKTLTARLDAAEKSAYPPLEPLSPVRDRPLSASKSTTESRDFTSSAPAMTSNTQPPASAPGEYFEPRQTATSDDYTPDPSKSLPLSPQRQALVDDIIALYSCAPTVQRVKRYTADCVYDDQFVYANDRYKMAGQWFALPKLFKASVNEGYEVIRSDDSMIQFKNKQSWTFKVIPKTATITGLVSLSLDPATRDTEFMQIKYHKDQANDKDYSHEGLGFTFKKWQADNVVKHIDAPELKEFEADKAASKEHVRKYGTGDESGDAPKQEFR